MGPNELQLLSYFWLTAAPVGVALWAFNRFFQRWRGKGDQKLMLIFIVLSSTIFCFLLFNLLEVKH